MIIMATTSLPAVDRPNADRWNAARSCQLDQVMRLMYQPMFLFQGPLLPLVYSIDAKNGDDAIIRNLPCLTRHNQLYCDNTGSSYPGKSIEKFIEDNKALLRRMYGEIQEVARDSRTLEESTR